jgi:hypothetical protein
VRPHRPGGRPEWLRNCLSVSANVLSAKGFVKLRTRVGRPKLRLIETSAATGEGDRAVGADEMSPQRAQALLAEALLAQALPAEAHAALDTSYHQRQMQARRLAANVDRLRYAVVDLASIDLSPGELIAALSPAFDEPLVREHLESALGYLGRLADEWRRVKGPAER